MTRRTILKMTGLSLIGGVMGACSRSMAASDDSAKQSTTQEAAMASSVSVKVINDKGEIVGPVTTARVVKSDEEWKKILTPDQFKIARAKGTERAFCGNLLDNHKEGIYACVCCSLPLFASSGKFESGTGWPQLFSSLWRRRMWSSMSTRALACSGRRFFVRGAIAIWGMCLTMGLGRRGCGFA